jgi:hypothetical protein
MSNYRPLSLLSSFSKVFERAIYNRLPFHVHSNNILAQEQYCFWTNSSTEVAAYNFKNSILTALANKLLVGGIFCDLTKALDYVKHDILLAKLEYYGINCKAGVLIKSDLNDRWKE